MNLFVLLILAVFASERTENAENGPEKGEGYKTGYEEILVKIEENEYDIKKSKFIGMTFHRASSKWEVQRRSKNGNKLLSGGYYDDAETAAHASDTLARKLMENGEKNRKLNFPDDHTEVYPEKKEISSKLIGVSYNERQSKWCAQRWSKNEKKLLSNGCYDDEEKAAHASDTLARKLMKNGEQKHKLNFPDDYTKVYPEKDKQFTSKFIGVSYREKISKWHVQRWSREEKKNFSNGHYDNEITAAHASDILARKLMNNGDHKIKLNFPKENFEANPEENQKKKRKRPKVLSSEHPQNN